MDNELRPLIISYACDPDRKPETIMVKSCFCKTAGTQVVCMATLPDGRTLAMVLAPGMKAIYFNGDEN